MIDYYLLSLAVLCRLYVLVLVFVCVYICVVGQMSLCASVSEGISAA